MIGEGADARAPAPRNRAFLAGLAVANLGAFVAFLPLLQVIVPLKAARIAPGDAATLVSQVAAVGAVVAGASNVAVGWLSDRTRSRFGRRKPWILAGVAGVVAGYALVGAARTPLQLIGALAAFQLAFNVLFAPFLALVPDRVPRDERGWASALVALGYPLGAALGAVVVGALLTGEGPRLLALSAIVVAAIVPFALRLSPDPPRPPAGEGPAVAGCGAGAEVAAAPGFASAATPGNFALGWLGRAGVMTATSLAQTYLLFYLLALPAGGGAHGAERAFAVLGVVFGAVTATACLAAGRACDLARRRRPFVAAGALTIAAGMLALALAPGWPWVVGAYAVYALGAGCHTAADFALMVDLLPSRDRPARDLGVVNLSNIAPQIVGPLMAGAILHAGADIRWVFALAAACAAMGAACVAAMHRVR